MRLKPETATQKTRKRPHNSIRFNAVRYRSVLFWTAVAPGLPMISLFFGIATFSYAAFSTIANTFPADLFTTDAVASVSGMGGAVAGMGTMLSTYAVGYIADHLGFRPALVGASFIPVIAMLVVLVLVRNTPASGRGIVLKI